MSYAGGLLGGINQTNKTLTSIITLSDGFITISGGNINNVNSMDIDNLEVGNLQVTGNTTLNVVSSNINTINVLNNNLLTSNVGNITTINNNLLTSNVGNITTINNNLLISNVGNITTINNNLLTSSVGNISFINASNINTSNAIVDKAYINDLFLSNINVQNANVTGNLFINNIRSFGGTLNIFSDLYVYGNIQYTLSNIVRYTDRNLELNYGGANVSAVGGGISILGTSNVILGNIYLDNEFDWTFTSRNNRINILSANITNGNIVNLNSTLITSSNIVSQNASINNIVLSGNISNVNTLTTTTISSNIIDSGNGFIDNLTSVKINVGNLQVGSAPFNPQNGTILSIVNNSVTDANIRGSLTGNVRNHLSYGSRNWTWAQDVTSDLTLFFGCQGGGDPDPDFEYYFKRSVGLQIQPNPSVITSDFNSALSVLGNVYIQREINCLSNLQVSNINCTLNISGDNLFINSNISSSNISSSNINTSNISTSNLNVTNTANITNISTSVIQSNKSLNDYVFTNRSVTFSSSTNFVNASMVRSNRAIIGKVEAETIDNVYLDTIGILLRSGNLDRFTFYYGSYPVNSISPGTAYSFNITFPNSFAFINPPMIILTSSNSNALHSGATSYLTNGFTLVGRNLSGSSTVSGVIMYIAIGPV